MREATLSVLDIFGQPVEEDEPMLMPLGPGFESSSSPSRQPSSGSSGEVREGRSEIENPGDSVAGDLEDLIAGDLEGTLVHQYLKQNSQVYMNHRNYV